MHLKNLIHLILFILLMCIYPISYSAQIDTLTSEATSPRPDKEMTPTSQEDVVITNSINSQIKQSATLSNLQVEVKTHKGVVTLSGNVDSDSQASSLIELAQATIGVKDVEAKNLKVKDSQQPLTDTMITAKVKGLFIREEIFGTKDIASINMSVETKNGIVYLTGVIENKEQIKNAIKLIEGIHGVKKVVYNVKKVSPN